MNKMSLITNETFGTSKAIHSPIDKEIQSKLDKIYGQYIESTNENDKTPSVKRRAHWEKCQQNIREFLKPLIDLSEFRWAYPTNGIHESIDWMCTKVKSYQVFEGEYRYPTFMKKPMGISKTPDDLFPEVPLYMSNPFSATGNFDNRYDEVCSTYPKMDVYLDMAFAGTTGEHQIKMYPNVKEVFWSCSKPYGLGLLRAGVRFVRQPELIQQELQGVGYFNHAIIDVFDTVISTNTVFQKKNLYAKQQEEICKHFNLKPSDSFLVGTTHDKEWDRFKRENGLNRVCLTPAYGVLND
jgi:hypothetical protein